ncbi:uncharacterized protein LOC107361867 [Tetranychus urticae]|uniref:uncharacterized protein LOC107361867 n=1 Tax=Tetranychus urticae TaxID=32264 RepID=UPI000355D164|nr:uncharacterized protein LOC107361867 [Tetranychus urticae]
MCEAIKILQSLPELTRKRNELQNQYNNITKDCYSLLCDYLGIENDGENPEQKIENEIEKYKELTAATKAEIVKIEKEKVKAKAKFLATKEKSAEFERLAANTEGAIDAQSKLNFKEFSRRMAANYRTGEDSKAYLVCFKIGETAKGTRSIKIDDPTKTKEQKMAEFWKLFEYIDKQNTNVKIIPN